MGTCSHCLPRTQIRTKWQETGSCPWFPHWRQRRNSGLYLWAPHFLWLWFQWQSRAILYPLRAQLSPLSLLRVFLGLSSAVPGLRPSVPCVAASPTLWGYPVIVAQSLGIESCQVSPSTLGPFQVPRWGPQPREVREIGRGTQIPSVADPGTVPKTADAWAVASL